MCFAPQRRCNFLTSNLQKVVRTRQFFHILTCKCASRHSSMQFFDIKPPKSGPTPSVFSNVLRATAACNFSTSELQKVLRHRQFFSIFTSKCAFCHSGAPFFTCLLNSYLRTRRFSEATFRTSGSTNHWKTQRFATSLTFRARVPAFYWLYTRVDLLSADLTSLLCLTPLLCFSTLHIVGS